MAPARVSSMAWSWSMQVFAVSALAVQSTQMPQPVRASQRLFDKRLTLVINAWWDAAPILRHDNRGQTTVSARFHAPRR